MLVSLKAASLGVNLVSANHVVLMGEPLTRAPLGWPCPEGWALGSAASAVPLHCYDRRGAS